MCRAGTAVEPTSGDGAQASEAPLAQPTRVTLDAEGNLYIADGGNHAVRRVDVDGRIRQVAGVPQSGDLQPTSVAVDAQGVLFVADGPNAVVSRVEPEGRMIRTSGIAVSAQGDLYISLRGGKHAVRRVSSNDGIVSTLAGTGSLSYSGDGGAALAARLWDPTGVAIGADGSVYVADQGNRAIRRVKDGTISKVAGLTQPLSLGRELAAARPVALIVSPRFTLFAGGATGTVQAHRTEESLVEVVAGRYPHAPGLSTTDRAKYRDQDFGEVYGVALDVARRRIFLSETTHYRLHVVMMPDPQDEESWTIQTLAGTGRVGNADGAALSASFDRPRGLWLVEDTLYVADTGNHCIRAIDLSFGLASATVAHVAGTAGMPGFAGDGGPAASALRSGRTTTPWEICT